MEKFIFCAVLDEFSVTIPRCYKDIYYTLTLSLFARLDFLTFSGGIEKQHQAVMG